MIDLGGEQRRIMNRNAAETYDPATMSLEAISYALAHGSSNLVYKAIITGVPAANQFTSTDLVGLGNGRFQAPGAGRSWVVYFSRLASGAVVLPLGGEMFSITGFNSATGTVTMGGAMAQNIGDEVLICHPAISLLITRLQDIQVPAADAVLNGYERDVIGNKADTALYAAAADASLMRYIKGILGANVILSTTVNDAAPAATDFDLGAEALAVANKYDGAVVLMMSGNAIGERHRIDAYTAARNASFAAGDQWTTVPANGDVCILLPGLGTGALGGGAVTAFAVGSQLTVINTEHFLANVNLPGKFRLVVDKNPMAAGDLLLIRAYQMVLTAGTSRVIGLWEFQGAQNADVEHSIFQSPDIWNELTDAQALRFSIQQTAGAVRTFPWKVLQG